MSADRVPEPHVDSDAFAPCSGGSPATGSDMAGREHARGAEGASFRHSGAVRHDRAAAGVTSQADVGPAADMTHHRHARPSLPTDLKLALVAPRNMRFSPHAATSIDLHIHETALWSQFRENIVVLAEEVDHPFADVRARFWPRGRSKGHLEQLLREENPALIVAHQHLPTAARLAARFPKVPVALVRHNFQNPPRNWLSGLWKRMAFNRLSAIAFVSERCRSSFEQNWPGMRMPVYVTPNGVDSGLWSADAEKKPIILFVGRLAPEKGVLEAAEGLERVLAQHHDWRAAFIIASSREHRDYAARVHATLARLGDRVEVIADAPHSEVRAWMARSAIAVAPTQGEESFGRVAVEAMASGAAVVASRASGFVEVVGDAGILLESPDAPHIAEAVEGLVRSPDRRAQLSRAARARVERRYDLSRSVVAFDRMVAEVLRRAGHDAPLDEPAGTR